MIVIDLRHHTSKNVSTMGMLDPQPRLGGGLQYVPNIGEGGLLVALGGKVFDGLQPVRAQSPGRLLNFDNVDVFDIASHTATRSNGTWHTQPTSGDIPPARIDSCTILASAPDNSSHNIFMYGGWDPTGNVTKYHDDIYVLSLPSYTWIKIFEGESPRYGHTCHLAAGHQLLTLGGSTQHGNITDTCDWEARSIAVMDLPTMTWGSVFSSAYAQYELGNDLVDRLGGTAQGNATTRVPSQGWASEDFEHLMSITRTYSNMDGTLEVFDPFAKKSGMSARTRAAIIASVTIFGVAILAGSAWLIRLKRKRRDDTADTKRSSGTTEDSFEIEDKARFELSSHEKAIYEVSGEGYMHEATEGTIRAEADRSNITPNAVELPAVDFSEKELWEMSFGDGRDPNVKECIHKNTSFANPACRDKKEGDMV